MGTVRLYQKNRGSVEKLKNELKLATNLHKQRKAVDTSDPFLFTMSNIFYINYEATVKCFFPLNFENHTYLNTCGDEPPSSNLVIFFGIHEHS